MVRLAALAITLVAHAGPSPTDARTWTGAISIDGSPWPMTVVIHGGDDPAARIDLDAIGMIDEPARCALNGDSVEIELPFGIGEFSLEPDGDGLRGSKDLGDNFVVKIALDRAPGGPGYTAHEVEFKSATATLAGTIYRPTNTKGPMPGCVLVHGSAVATRAEWDSKRWVKALMKQGVAVLVYDRRGEGASTETEPDVGFAHLASDALAGIARLAGEQGVDPDRIGLLGSSQGAWIAARAAAESGRVAFLILTGVPGVTPAEQQRQVTEERMRRAGMAHEHIQDALAYTGLYFYTVRTGEGIELLREAGERAAEAPWGRFVDMPETLEQLTWWRDHHDFDMQGTLARCAVPMLAMWGSADVVVPPTHNRLILERATDGRATTVVIADADHGLEREGMFRADDGTWVWPRLAPEAVEAIGEFVAER